MRYVISGAAGFIGSHLCDRLLSAGHQVVAIDNLITGRRQNLSHLEKYNGFEYFERDVCGPFVVQGKVDRVFHLASLESPVEYLKRPLEALEAGSSGTRNMLELAREKGARFLLTSTSEFCGESSQSLPVADPAAPHSCYAASKRYAEALTMAYYRVHAMKTNIARVCDTYGPRMALNDGRVVSAFIEQAITGAGFGDETHSRGFCYVSDMVDGLARLSDSEERDPVHLQPGLAKTKTLLGWEPKVGLREGVSKTLAYFKQFEGIPMQPVYRLPKATLG